MNTTSNKIPKEFIDEVTGEIIYPESDGQPMAENTTHFQKITTIQGGIDSLFASRTDVFVAGDLLWYPEKGKPYIRVAPDILVAFGRPKGHRGSYEQWNEDDIAPQVVMEVLSPGNTVPEMLDKHLFYQKYGVEEYYVLDYQKLKLYVWNRIENRLDTIPVIKDYTSPLLGIKFEIKEDDDLYIYNPDGTPFLTFVELDEERKEAVKAKEKALAVAEEEKESERRSYFTDRRGEESERRSYFTDRRGEESERRSYFTDRRGEESERRSYFTDRRGEESERRSYFTDRRGEESERRSY